jgi:hypothetical protein
MKIRIINMKINIHLLLLLLLLLPFSHLRAQNKLLIKDIEYDVPINNKYLNDILRGEGDNLDWWDRNIETSKRISFLKTLINKAEKGEINVYDEKGNLLSLHNIYRILNHCDTISHIDSLPPYDEKYMIICHEIYGNNIQYLRFQEQWYYDIKTLKIEKRIIRYAPVLVEYNEKNKRTSQVKALFWIKYNNDTAKDYKPFTDLLRYEIPLFPDTATYYQIQLKYISDDTTVRNQYLDSLYSATEKGEIQAYDCIDMESYYNYDSDNLLPVRKSDLFLRFKEMDSVIVQSTEPPFDSHKNVLKLGLCYNTTGLMFVERWLIDSKTLEIKKEIIGIAHYVKVYEPDGITYKGARPIYYYSFEKPSRHFELK